VGEGNNASLTVRSLSKEITNTCTHCHCRSILFMYWEWERQIEINEWWCWNGRNRCRIGHESTMWCDGRDFLIVQKNLRLLH
jgi:hypothetical protein